MADAAPNRKELRRLDAAGAVAAYQVVLARRMQESAVATLPCDVKERSVGMARYGKKAQSKVKKVMEERKRGTLKSGRSGKKVTSRKQAIAIGLAEARKAGAKVPPRASSSTQD